MGKIVRGKQTGRVELPTQRVCKSCLEAYKKSPEGLAERDKVFKGRSGKWGNHNWPDSVCFYGSGNICPDCLRKKHPLCKPLSKKQLAQQELDAKVQAAHDASQSEIDLQNQRRPEWADPRALSLVYRKAREIEKATGVPQDVEHVIPLQGKLVSGLHVAGNLRIVPKGQARPEDAEFTPGSLDEIFGASK